MSEGTQKERTVAFVVARLSSSRLPAKQLREVGGKMILDHIFDALARAEELDEAVLATVSESQNEPLRQYCEQKSVPLFWYEGEVDQVTTRLVEAAERFEAEICLLISADCPLVHAGSIDQLVRTLRDHPEADFISLPPLEGGERLLLEGVHVARASAWRRAEELSDRPELKEHQFPIIYRRPDLFKPNPTRLSPEVYGERHRLSVDTWADLEFFEALYGRLAKIGEPFELPNAVMLLKEEPALKELNAHVHQRLLVEEVKKVLLAVDAGRCEATGRELGYGHFMRSRELAGQLVERLGWPVTMVLDDLQAAQSAETCGFRVLWGALGRTANPKPDELAHLDESSVATALRHHDALVIDISAARELGPGWRDGLDSPAPVAMIDRADATAEEAHLIIFPGVQGRAERGRGKGPKVLEGTGYAIVRREVRRLAVLRREKSLDIAAYLYPAEQRAALDEAATSQGWSLYSPEGFSQNFLDHLSRAKVFVSGYGQSFYEALALGVIPVAWPLGPLHRADALAFYEAFGMEPLIVETPEQLGPLLKRVLTSEAPPPRLDDGTPAIVEALAGLCRNDCDE